MAGSVVYTIGMHTIRSVRSGVPCAGLLFGLIVCLAPAMGCSSSSSSPSDASTEDTSSADTSTGDTSTGDTATADTATIDAHEAAIPCGVPTDCPAPPNECVVNTCNANVCGVVLLTSSHVMKAGQITGDCKVLVCDGAGGITSIDDATDVPKLTTVCQTNPVCSGTPLAPHFMDAPTGTSCVADGKLGKYVCGSTTVPAVAGTCVECNVAADCSFGDGGFFGDGGGGGGSCSGNICI